MKPLDERSQAREVLARWRSQYPLKSPLRERFLSTENRLAALDTETATAADIEAITGNESWCQPQECEECRESSWMCVELGHEEFRQLTICRQCLVAAIALLPDTPR